MTNDATARLGVLQSGGADIINQVDRQVAGFLDQSSGLEVVRRSGSKAMSPVVYPT